MLSALDWVPEDAAKVPSRGHAGWMRSHTHDHEYSEIVVTLHGAHVYGAGGMAVPLAPGSALLFPIKQPHDADYSKYHAECVDFWFHILPHGKVVVNFVDHHPKRRIIYRSAPGLNIQFQEDFRRASELLSAPDAAASKKTRCFLLYLLHESIEFLRDARFDQPTDSGKSVIEDVKLYAARHLTDRLTLGDLAKAAGYSPFHFHRIFLEVEGITPRLFVEAHRLKNACDLLKTGYTITSAALDSGFSTPAQFTSIFKKKFGIPPSRWLETVAPLDRDADNP